MWQFENYQDKDRRDMEICFQSITLYKMHLDSQYITHLDK